MQHPSSPIGGVYWPPKALFWASLHIWLAWSNCASIQTLVPFYFLLLFVYIPHDGGPKCYLQFSQVGHIYGASRVIFKPAWVV